MRRTLSLACLCATTVLVLLLVGCGGSGGGGAPPPVDPGAGQPIDVGPVTATPGAGEELRSEIVAADGGPEVGFVIWGGAIADLRTALRGAHLGEVVYAAGTAAEHGIRIVNTGTGVKRTVVDSDYDALEPTWIDDGERIAYQLQIGSNIDLYVMNADGRGQGLLTRQGFSMSTDELHPSGGRRSGSVLFVADYNGDTFAELCKLDTDTGTVTTLLSGAVHHRHPGWAPEGYRYVYSANSGATWDLWAQPDGVGPPSLITPAAGSEDEPSWSPDGTRIAMSRAVAGNWDIWVCDADGSHLTRLTNNVADDRHPTWSPDGRHIAFSSKRTGNGDIYVMNADGSSETPLVTDASEDLQPEWCPRSRETRVFVGPAGSDGGFDPPFGTGALKFAYIGGDDNGIIMFGLRCAGGAASVEVNSLNTSSYPLPYGFQVHTPDIITLLGEDTGRGNPIVQHINNVGSTATFVGDFDNVAFIFSEGSVPIAIVPWLGAPKTMIPLDVGTATAEPTFELSGNDLVVRGDQLARPGGGYCSELVFDAGTGEVIQAR